MRIDKIEFRNASAICGEMEMSAEGCRAAFIMAADGLDYTGWIKFTLHSGTSLAWDGAKPANIAYEDVVIEAFQQSVYVDAHCAPVNVAHVLEELRRISPKMF